MILGRMHMKRSKGRRLPTFGMTLFLLKLVVSKNCIVIDVKGCLVFKVPILPQYLVSIWLRVSNNWVPIRSRRL